MTVGTNFKATRAFVNALQVQVDKDKEFKALLELALSNGSSVRKLEGQYQVVLLDGQVTTGESVVEALIAAKTLIEHDQNG